MSFPKALNQSHSLAHRLSLTVLFFVALILSLTQINSLEVTFTDELLFEEAAYNMAISGQYLIPSINNVPWLEKPPVYFWLTAPVFHVANLFTSIDILDLSQSLNTNNIFLYPWIRRFWTFIAFHVTLLFTYKIARHLYSPTTGLIAYLLLLTTPLYLFSSTSASLDLTATAFITISIFFYLKIHNKHTNKKLLTTNYLLLATCISAAFLTRSFLALTPLGVIFLHQLITTKKIPVFFWILNSVFCLLVFPWHLYAYVNHPDLFTSTYLGWNLIQHSLQLTPGYESTTPFYYLILLLIQIPWTYLILVPFILKIFKSPKLKTFLTNLKSSFWPSPESNDFNTLILALWFLIPFTILSLSTTRQSWYFIQVLPPIAILAASHLQKLWINLQSPQREYQKNLFELGFLSFIISMIVILFVYQDRSASTIKALHFLTQITSPHETVYNLNYGFLPHTPLYQPRPVLTIKPNQLPHLPAQSYIYISDLDAHHTQGLHVINSFKPGTIYQIP